MITIMYLEESLKNKNVKRSQAFRSVFIGLMGWRDSTGVKVLSWYIVELSKHPGIASRSGLSQNKKELMESSELVLNFPASHQFFAIMFTILAIS